VCVCACVRACLRTRGDLEDDKDGVDVNFNGLLCVPDLHRRQARQLSLLLHYYV
jgi:hypothetical protein